LTFDCKSTPPSIPMNRLAREKSPYLRHAANQKIDWHPWSEDAFEIARREDKPVFLSTGAVWCHWCHVMARESFEDDETARLMNELYVNIKLDRDERPDIDRRYQQAVAAMGAGSGWPLSVFLTPDKAPFYGGTYFPPDDVQGRPGFKKVLTSVSDFYREKKDDAVLFGARVMETLKPLPFSAEKISKALADEAEINMLAAFDARNGGFGTSPKFPMPGALEFLILRSAAGRGPAVDLAARRTLEAMARGGFHDQLGGGFHRYSTDEAWTIPHFEKMADDNAGLLNNYADAYAVFHDERFREVALGIIHFTRTVLSDPRGGFYASQDADVTPDDDGGYFTWTETEFKEFLDAEEYEVLSLHLLNDRAAMHHEPRKTVLMQSRSPEEVAASLGRPVDEVRRIIQRGKEKLLSERGRRKAPCVDKTLYTSLNSMLISSWLHASAVLGDEQAENFALQSLDRVLSERLVDGELFHAVHVRAGLDDWVHLIDALIVAYEITAESRYLKQADEFAATCLTKFYDDHGGGFFDTEEEVLGTRMKRIEDAPHPSANAVAVMLLLKLHHLTGKNEYRDAAEQTLGIFSGLARELGVHAGAYFSALNARFRMLRFTVEAKPVSDLARAVLALPRGAAVIVYGEDRRRVIPCLNDVCYKPLRDVEGVANLFKNLPNP
jgi:uncharacterized protein YyaL (SSP411 family)